MSSQIWINEKIIKQIYCCVSVKYISLKFNNIAYHYLETFLVYQDYQEY